MKHPQNRIRQIHYLKMVREAIEDRNEKNDIARYFTFEFGKSNHDLKPNLISDDEHKK